MKKHLLKGFENIKIITLIDQVEKELPKSVINSILSSLDREISDFGNSIPNINYMSTGEADEWSYDGMIFEVRYFKTNKRVFIERTF